MEIADLALLLWVPVSFLFWLRLRPAVAVGSAIIGGLLLLPEGVSFDPPVLPALDKQRLAVLSAFAACVLFAPRRLARPPLGPAAGFALLLLLASFGTALTNTDPVELGWNRLPALRLWDGVSLAGMALLDLVLPFYLGWTLYRRPRELGQLLVLVTLAACVHSLLILFEVRMSPRLHHDVYGYQTWGWQGAARGGWFRPSVFMHGGLALAIFAATTVIAAAAVYRAREPLLPNPRWPWLRLPAGPVAIYLLVVLAACRSLAAFVYGAGTALVLFFLRARPAMLLAVVLSGLVILYPVLRSFDLFPTDTLVRAAGEFSIDRAESLDFRFRHETRLLARAQERPVFGWGAWRRNRVYNLRTGLDTSITDGYWVITLGIRGAAGFIGTFGLLLTPVFAAARRFGRLRSRRDRWLVAGCAWIVAVNAIDLLPNAMLNSLVVFVAGALLGATTRLGPAAPRLRTRRRKRERRVADVLPPEANRPRPA